MATRLVGHDAIAFAERNGCLLSVRASAGEPARDGVSVEEARVLAAKEASHVYVDFDEEEHSAPAGWTAGNGEGGERLA
jgi:hypothetical protein